MNSLVIVSRLEPQIKCAVKSSFAVGMIFAFQMGCSGEIPSFEEQNQEWVSSADGSSIEVIRTDGAGDSNAADLEVGKDTDSDGKLGRMISIDAKNLSTSSGTRNSQKNTVNGKANVDSVDVEGASTSELTGCAKQFGSEVKSIVVAGRKSRHLFVPDGSVLAVKVTGHSNEVVIDLNNFSGQLAGLCLFLAGDQPKATINLANGTTIETVYYVGRGNQSAGHFEVDASSEIETIHADLGGHLPKLELRGEGKYPCQEFNGNTATSLCE